MFKLEEKLRPHLLALQAYSSARDEYTGKEGMFLDANENPFEWEGLPGVNRYPDPYQQKLKELISGIKHIEKEKIFLGNGSDEAIDLLIRAFCEPGKDSIIILPPTYGMYEVSANIHNVGIKRIQLNSNFQLDSQRILVEADDKDKMLFICSPNNPTANLIERKAILDMLRQFKGIVVVDEAYIDFAPEGSSLIAELKNYPNLVILQTFSKGWGMAGLRLGMAFASAELIRLLNKIKPPYNINLLTQNAAIKALSKPEKLNQWVGILLAERQKLQEALQTLPYVERVYPSNANFLLVKMAKAREVYHYLLDQLIIVRDRSKVILCDDCLRITVGSSTENIALIKALENYPKQ
jgi:histidinol-phosphate aminotransferase